MNSCPTEAQWQRLIADLASSGEQVALEAHLGACSPCREQLDRLAGVTIIPKQDAGHAGPAVESSPTLRLIMDRLKAESPSAPVTVVPETGSGATHFHPQLQPPAQPGHLGRLGNLEVRRVLGHGGMGVVYEGFDPALSRTVAIKVLSPRLLGDAAARSRFLSEARAAAALAHANVVTIHAIDQTGETPFLVMQYVRGETLHDRLNREGKLPLEEVIRLGIQVARGLAAAHERGLIHRDIKPANILLEEATGDVRIADFGLAKHLGAPSITGVGQIAGTPAYMSPEQAEGKVLDARSDLFSLGSILYRAVTGVAPFAGDSPYVLLDQVRRAAPKPLASLEPALPNWFCTVVHRLLAKNPEDRIQSAAKLAGLLERRTVAPAAVTEWRKFAAVMAALVLAALGGLAIGGYWHGPTSPRLTDARPSEWFSVTGMNARFVTLQEAIQAAGDNAVVEVHGNGPFPTAPILIEGKRLTVRAAAGFAPVFVPEAAADPSKLRFIRTDADLRLEGLEIIWKANNPAVRTEEIVERSVVSGGRNRLTVIHCRIQCGPMNCCIGSISGELTVEHCHLLSPAGPCIGWQPGATQLRVEQSFLEGRSGVILRMTAAPEMALARASFTHNTFAVAARAWHIILEAQPRQPVPVAARLNLVDSSYPVALFASMPRKTVTTHAAMTEAVRWAIQWSEENNVYSKGCVYLSCVQQPRGNTVLPADFHKIDQWLEFWGLPKDCSVEGKIHFADRPASAALTTPLRLARIDQGTGPVPAKVGADPDRLGPGPAYHEWRRSGGAGPQERAP